MEEIQNRWKEEQATNKLNSVKEKFRSALNEYRITDPKAVDMAISANLSIAQNSEDLGALAQSIAEANPFLTASVHKGGAGTMPPRLNPEAPKSLRDCKTPAEEAAYFEAQIQADQL